MGEPPKGSSHSRKSIRFLRREGWRSLLCALVSIWRTRLRVTLNNAHNSLKSSWISMTLPSEAFNGGDAFFGCPGKPVSQIGLRILEVGKPPFFHGLFDHRVSVIPCSDYFCGRLFRKTSSQWRAGSRSRLTGRSLSSVPQQSRAGTAPHRIHAGPDERL
jgi:hypothetical protein